MINMEFNKYVYIKKNSYDFSKFDGFKKIKVLYMNFHMKHKHQ